MISISQFKIICKTIHFSLIVIGIILFLYHIHYAYSLFLVNKNFILQAESFQFIEKNIKPLANLLLLYLSSVGWLCLKLITIGFIYFLFNRIPIPSFFIFHWFKEKEISPILGKIFINHYRWNHFLNIKEFLECYSGAKIEQYYLHLHSHNKNLEPLFKTYDKDYLIDKE